MVLHLPIGLIAGLAAIEAAARLRRKPASREITRLLAWLAAGSAVLTAATGYVLSLEGEHGGATLSWHLRSGIVLAVVCVAMALAGFAKVRARPYRVLLLLTLGLLIPTGHLGASMTHGERFLVEPFAGGPAKPAATSLPSDATPAPGGVFATRIAPIFAERCIGCHGETRQRGGLALHTPETIARGGRDGPVFVAGKPRESEMVRRLRLPLDEDDHMPPAGKPQPTEEEIRAIESWIEAGAPFGAAVPALAPSDGDTIAGAATKRSLHDTGSDVPPADPTALTALRAHYVHVEPVAAGSNRLWVSFGATAATTDDAEAARLLEPLLPQLDTLSLGRCAVGDRTAAFLARADGLRRLDLRGTRVTDAGVAAISRLSGLEELVLAQTHLTDAAAAHLAAMPSLQRVYVWKSGLGAQAIATLRERRPGLHVDAGDAAEAAVEGKEPDITLTSGAPLPGQTATAAALGPINATCPVSGSPVDPRYVIVYKNRAIGFCCAKCPAQFWADPARFESRLPPAKP
jgi:mono/diheme cytochrome c family protein